MGAPYIASFGGWHTPFPNSRESGCPIHRVFCDVWDPPAPPQLKILGRRRGWACILGDMAGKGLVAKSTAMLLVSLAAICYCGAVLAGHLSKERRLGPSELGILLLAAAVCIVLRWPHLVDRISAIKVAGLDVALREI